MIYIQNPPMDWQFGRVVTLNKTQNAMLLSLQKTQAIALMLKNEVAVD